MTGTVLSRRLNRRSSAIRQCGGVLLILGSFFPMSAAHADCNSNFICIHADQLADQIQLRAENLSEFPITYTVRVRPQDMNTSVPRTVTRTLPGHDSEIALSLRKTASDPGDQYQFSYDWTVGDRNAAHDEDYVYRLPYASGKSYRVLQGFGSRFSHTGLEQFAIDFLMKEGTPVHAARGGIVARLEESNSIGCRQEGCDRHANYVVILHDDGTTGEYYHLLENGVLVDVGERVSAGEQIALSGNTGHTTVAHLHFAVYRAVEWGGAQSIPVRFASADGIVDRPRQGGRYQATASPRVNNDNFHTSNHYGTE